MEDAKKERTSKARTLSRRIRELSNIIKSDGSIVEVEEKMAAVKYSFEQLGDLQDMVMEYLEDDVEGTAQNVKWYDAYDEKVNWVILSARRYIEGNEKTAKDKDTIPVKLAKLKLPVFEGDHKNYLKWKETFERYTKDLTDDIKYDYLVSSTKGKGNEIVLSKKTYEEAISRLDKEFGDKLLIMSLLIEELRAVSIVRKGDFKAFENFAFKANNFKDRLEEMGLGREAENTYILKELEGKLNMEDMQKWLESMGKDVDERKVADFVKWLDHQKTIRRISYSTLNKSNNPLPSHLDKFKKLNMNTTGQMSCELCSVEDGHEITECPVFIAWDLDEKWNFASRKRLCFQCLKSGHRSDTCTEPKCIYCKRPHHCMLHKESWNSSVLKGCNNSFEDQKSGRPLRCFLPVVNATVIGENNRIRVTAMLDSGSELNVISSKLYEKLGLRGFETDISIIGVSGLSVRKSTKVVDIFVEDRLGCRTKIQCVVLDKTCGNAISVDPRIVQSLERIGISGGMVTAGGEIDLLIGMTYPNLHQQTALYGNDRGLTVMETRFGPTLVGPVPYGSRCNYECGVFNTSRISFEDEESLLKAVESELAGIYKECACNEKTDDELLFETAMKDAWSVDETGRFEVKLPWKSTRNNLRNNRVQAWSRSMNLEKYLKKKDPGLLKLFQEQVTEMITTDVLREVPPSYPHRYLPLLAVITPEKESTKLRVCLDSKSKFAGLSLNDALLKGKMKMNDIFETILQFRCGKYTLVGDIRKMFWQIKITEEDQKYHGVIFNGKTYVFTRVGFGNNNSPPIADTGMLKMAYNGKESHPLAARALIDNRYMDDITDANSSAAVLIKTRNEIDDLIGGYG